jgi:hypothetical protein
VADAYLIDANVFVQAKNLHYRFEFCGGFWHWLESAHAAGLVFSVDKVRSELVAGRKGDPARTWAEQQNHCIGNPATRQDRRPGMSHICPSRGEPMEGMRSIGSSAAIAASNIRSPRAKPPSWA